MGNIINLSPGDLVDRQTILELKIEHCGTEGNTGHQPVSEETFSVSPQETITRTKLLEKTEVNIQPMIIEHEAIQKRLEMDWFPKISTAVGEQFDKLYQQLRQTNKEMWQLENQARILRAAPKRVVAKLLDNMDTVVLRKSECLDAISTTNDTRISLVKQINALWNIESEAKIYA